MKTIDMPHHKFTIVDDEDFDLSKYKWSVANTGYAQANIGHKTVAHLHRLIGERMLRRSFKKGEIIDHINRNKLDNRRSNLRVTTQSVNLFNRNLQSNNKSGVSGINFYNKKYVIKNKTYVYPTWVATIKVKGKKIYLGGHKTFEQARQARIDAEIKYFGFRVTE